MLALEAITFSVDGPGRLCLERAGPGLLRWAVHDGTQIVAAGQREVRDVHDAVLLAHDLAAKLGQDDPREGLMRLATTAAELARRISRPAGPGARPGPVG